MKRYIHRLQVWFEQRSTRERLLVIFLSWAFLYALFYLFLFRPLEAREALLLAQIKNEKNNISNWNIQITALNKLAQSPLYKQWVQQTKAMQKLRSQSKYLFKTSSIKQEDIVKTLLQLQTNVRIEQIKNFPETLYTPTSLLKSAYPLYQQRLMMVMYSNYLDTISYLEMLEQKFPNVYWDNLTYTVEQYPLAKVEMEFSLLYEKTR